MRNVIDSSARKHFAKKPPFFDERSAVERVGRSGWQLPFLTSVTGRIMKKVPCWWQRASRQHRVGWKIYCNKKPSSAAASLKLVSGVQKRVGAGGWVGYLSICDWWTHQCCWCAGQEGISLCNGWRASLLETQKRFALINRINAYQRWCTLLSLNSASGVSENRGLARASEVVGSRRERSYM